MEIFFLGTGGSEGIPCPHCTCSHCEEARKWPLLQRRPSAVLILGPSGETLLLDAGTDISDVCDGLDVRAVLLTHWHADHFSGLFRLSWMKRTVPFIHPEPERKLCGFREGLLPYQAKPFERLAIANFYLIPLPLCHEIPTWGYLVEEKGGPKAAFLWDTKGLPERTLSFLQGQGVQLAVLDATYPPEKRAPNHNNLPEAVNLGLSLAEEVILTHFSHHQWPPFRIADYLAHTHPEDKIGLAYDGLRYSLRETNYSLLSMETRPKDL